MRLTLLLIGLLALSASSLSASAVIDCNVAPGGFVASPDNVLFSYPVWTAAGFTCEQEDKIYSNFSPGAAPTDTTLKLLLQTLPGGVQAHTVIFSGSFTSDFTVSYTISVDTSITLDRISSVTGDIDNPGNLGAPSNLKTVFGAGGFTGSLTSVVGSPGIPIVVPFLSSLDVTDAYTANGGGSANISNSFFQSDPPPPTPEPATIALLGTGLLGLCLIQRHRRAKC